MNQQTLSPAHVQAMDELQDASLPWKVLLVDDDPMYCRIMARAAGLEGIDVRPCGTMKELAAVPDINSFDLVLLDYHLGFTTGTRLSGFLSLFFGDVPVVMISTSSEWWHTTGANWPLNVRGFIHKDRDMREMVGQVKRAIKENIIEVANEMRNETEPYFLSSRVEYIAPEDPWSMSRVVSRRVMGGMGKMLLRVRSLL